MSLCEAAEMSMRALLGETVRSFYITGQIESVFSYLLLTRHLLVKHLRLQLLQAWKRQ